MKNSRKTFQKNLSNIMRGEKYETSVNKAINWAEPILVRKDDSKGFEADNVLFVCKTVAVSKGNLTWKQWYDELVKLREAFKVSEEPELSDLSKQVKANFKREDIIGDMFSNMLIKVKHDLDTIEIV